MEFFKLLVGDSSIADILIDSEDVNAITFTGSVTAGVKWLKEQHHK